MASHQLPERESRFGGLPKEVVDAVLTSEDESTTGTGEEGKKKKKKKTKGGGIKERAGSLKNIFQKAGNSRTEGNAETERLERSSSTPSSSLDSSSSSRENSTVRMAPEWREIEYEDLISEKMGLSHRYMLCKHCFIKKKYKIIGRLRIEDGKKPVFDGTAAVSGAESIPFSIKRDSVNKAGIF